MMFAISSFRMLSFVLNITFEWEAAVSWPSVVKIFFRKLTTCVWEKGNDGAGHWSLLGIEDSDLRCAYFSAGPAMQAM